MDGGQVTAGAAKLVRIVGIQTMSNVANSKPLRVAIVDDEPLARARMRRLLWELPQGQVVLVLECETAEDWLRLGPSESLDLVFLDIEMPGFDGLSAVENWPGRKPQIVFVSAHHEYAVRAFDVQAADYLTKPVLSARLEAALDRAVMLHEAAKAIHDPWANLTERQREILALLMSQKSNKEVARSLALSHFTVRNHMSVLFRTFAVSGRRELIEVISATAPCLGAGPAAFPEVAEPDVYRVSVGR